MTPAPSTRMAEASVSVSVRAQDRTRISRAANRANPAASRTSRNRLAHRAQVRVLPRRERAKGGRAQQNARKQLTICERDMEKLESEIKALEADMEASACDYEKYSALYAQKETLDQQLMELMERWEALAEAAEG